MGYSLPTPGLGYQVSQPDGDMSRGISRIACLQLTECLSYTQAAGDGSGGISWGEQGHLSPANVTFFCFVASKSFAAPGSQRQPDNEEI